MLISGRRVVCGGQPYWLWLAALAYSSVETFTGRRGKKGGEGTRDHKPVTISHVPWPFTTAKLSNS